MTRTRPAAGPDRRLAVLASLVMLVGCLLPWYAWSGELPSSPRRGWEGSGILVAIAALGVLALLTFPGANDAEASGRADRNAPGARVVDRPLPWVLLAALAIVGLVAWPLVWLDEPAGLLPARAPGLWVAAVGTVLLVVAAAAAWRRRGRG